jgi:hypothetical protein
MALGVSDRVCGLLDTALITQHITSITTAPGRHFGLLKGGKDSA